MEKRGNKLIYILVGIIILLVFLSGYYIYSDNQSKKEIDRLNQELDITQNQLQQVSQDKQILDEKYGLLVDDVAEIYKGCINDNKCKGRYPNVSWYCNNVGDEVSDPSHVCKCDSSCNLITNPIN